MTPQTNEMDEMKLMNLRRLGGGNISVNTLKAEREREECERQDGKQNSLDRSGM